MATIIKTLAFNDGSLCPGMYLKSFDHEADDGVGYGEFTDDPQAALRFETFAEAFEFWRKAPKCRPLREDGKPNRPLTATTIGFENV